MPRREPLPRTLKSGRPHLLLTIALLSVTGCGDEEGRGDFDTPHAAHEQALFGGPILEDEGISIFGDFDRDGYTNDVDCDDLDPTINPGAPEGSDSVDNNCNGVVDERAFYVNPDEGIGDDSTTCADNESGQPFRSVARAFECAKVLNLNELTNGKFDYSPFGVVSPWTYDADAADPWSLTASDGRKASSGMMLDCSADACNATLKQEGIPVRQGLARVSVWTRREDDKANPPIQLKATLEFNDTDTTTRTQTLTRTAGEGRAASVDREEIPFMYPDWQYMEATFQVPEDATEASLTFYLDSDESMDESTVYLDDASFQVVPNLGFDEYTNVASMSLTDHGWSQRELAGYSGVAEVVNSRALSGRAGNQNSLEMSGASIVDSVLIPINNSEDSRPHLRPTFALSAWYRAQGDCGFAACELTFEMTWCRNSSCTSAHSWRPSVVETWTPDTSTWGESPWREVTLGPVSAPRRASFLRITIKSDVPSDSKVWVDSLDLDASHLKGHAVMLQGGSYAESCLAVPSSGASDAHPFLIAPQNGHDAIFEGTTFENDALGCQHVVRSVTSTDNKFNRSVFYARSQNFTVFRGISFNVGEFTDKAHHAIDIGNRYGDELGRDKRYVKDVRIEDVVATYPAVDNDMAIPVTIRNCIGCTVTGSRFTGGSVGVNIDGRRHSGWGFTVDDNIFEEQASKGMVMSVDYGHDEKNTISNNSLTINHIGIDTNLYNGTISGNDFVCNTHVGDEAISTSAMETNGRDITAQHNTFLNCGTAFKTRTEDLENFPNFDEPTLADDITINADDTITVPVKTTIDKGLPLSTHAWSHKIDSVGNRLGRLFICTGPTCLEQVKDSGSTFTEFIDTGATLRGEVVDFIRDTPTTGRLKVDIHSQPAGLEHHALEDIIDNINENSTTDQPFNAVWMINYTDINISQNHSRVCTPPDTSGDLQSTESFFFTTSFKRRNHKGGVSMRNITIQDNYVCHADADGTMVGSNGSPSIQLDGIAEGFHLDDFYLYGADKGILLRSLDDYAAEVASTFSISINTSISIDETMVIINSNKYFQDDSEMDWYRSASVTVKPSSDPSGTFSRTCDNTKMPSCP